METIENVKKRENVKCIPEVLGAEFCSVHSLRVGITHKNSNPFTDWFFFSRGLRLECHHHSS